MELEIGPEADRTANRIVATLPPESRQALLKRSDRVRLRVRDVLHTAGGKIADVYFIERGMVLHARPLRDARAIAVATVGSEGLSPLLAGFSQDDAILESIVEIEGSALRMNRDALRRCVAKYPPIAFALRRYTAAALSEIAQTAACNALHTVERRCCRWLLTAHDRSDGSFPMTHESLAASLGVRRATVSTVAGGLQAARLIRYAHGKVTVVDRQGLERSSCECYRTVRSDFERAFAAMAMGA
ncbi:MAG TPA: Crp/Fnr family transcriptional regulator [Candidatus Acidoferrales bacterium]|nr:Crp/Fnr family transcriptional regulator [Candidatus Acidoferrales bacterium]